MRDHVPAFPLPKDYDEAGMDLRDYFAGQIMAARIVGGFMFYPDADLLAVLARQAYEAADAMMEARKK